MTDAASEVAACIGRTDEARLQNVLMAMGDKICAVALSTLAVERRESVLARIAPAKAKRVREEIRLESRRRTTPAVKERIIRAFLASFEARPPARPRVYIRPRRDR
jgi:hypothetical protein